MQTSNSGNKPVATIEILRFAVPLVLSFVVSRLLILADLKMVGHLDPTILSIFSIADAAMIAFPVLSFFYRAQYIVDLRNSLKSNSDVSKLIGSYSVVVLIMGFLGASIGAILTWVVLPAVGTFSQTSLAVAQSYLLWVLPARIPEMLWILISLVFVVMKRPWEVFWVGGAANLVNIAFNYILINGIEGLVPALGAAGCGISTLIVSTFTLVFFAIRMHKKLDFHWKLSFPDHSFFARFKHLSGQEFLRISAASAGTFLIVVILGFHSESSTCLAINSAMVAIWSVLSASINGALSRTVMVMADKARPSSVIIPVLSIGATIAATILITTAFFSKEFARYFFPEPVIAASFRPYVSMIAFIWFASLCTSVTRATMQLREQFSVVLKLDFFFDVIIMTALILFFVLTNFDPAYLAAAYLIKEISLLLAYSISFYSLNRSRTNIATGASA